MSESATLFDSSSVLRRGDLVVVAVGSVRVEVLAEALWEVVACWGVVEVFELESSASLSESSQAMSSSSGAEAASVLHVG